MAEDIVMDTEIQVWRRQRSVLLAASGEYAQAACAQRSPLKPVSTPAAETALGNQL